VKKSDLAKHLARQSGVTEAEAADRLDRVVHEIVSNLHSGKSASLPGLGRFRSGAGGKVRFEREGAIAVADGPEAGREVARVVACGWKGGKIVEIGGLGVFFPDARQGLRFEPQTLPRVFLGHVREDAPFAARLYSELQAAGVSPWMDVRNLLPGQNWPRAIENAIDGSDLSSRAIRQD